MRKMATATAEEIRFTPGTMYWAVGQIDPSHKKIVIVIDREGNQITAAFVDYVGMGESHGINDHEAMQLGGPDDKYWVSTTVVVPKDAMYAASVLQAQYKDRIAKRA